MDVERMIVRLEGFPGIVRGVVGVVGRDAGWRPGTGAWSAAEIVYHLLDEERHDFRPRVAATLSGRPWTPIDPEATVASARVRGEDATAHAEAFAAERAASVAWLRGLGAADWEATHAHPSGRAIKAGEVMSAWVDHDALHLRQLAKRLHELAERDGAPYGTGYAGAWGA